MPEPTDPYVPTPAEVLQAKAKSDTTPPEKVPGSEDLPDDVRNGDIEDHDHGEDNPDVQDEPVIEEGDR